jgi:glycosyltransferase involved in cell wall biosynthesis
VLAFLSSFNRNDLLAEAVESVLDQTYENVRLLLVDDGSSDGSDEICLRYANRYPKQVEAICLKRNIGLRRTTNLALGRVREDELFAFQAHDDVWEPRRIEAAVDAMGSDEGIGAVFSDADLIDESGRRLGRRFSDDWGPIASVDDWFSELLAFGNRLCATTSTVRGSVIRSGRLELPPGIELCGDYYLWLTISASHRILVLPEVLSRYRVSAGQMSRRTHETQEEDYRIPILARRRSSAVRRRLPASALRGRCISRAGMYLEARRRERDVAGALRFGRRLVLSERSGQSVLRAARALWSTIRPRGSDDAS